MDLVILRYVHFVCMAFLFDINVQCDQYNHSNTTGDWLQQLKTTGCASNCMHNDPSATLEACIKQCAEQLRLDTKQPAHAQPLPFDPPIALRVQRLCRDDTSMWLQLQNQTDGAELQLAGLAASDRPRPLIIFRLQETGNNMLAMNTVYITDRTTVHITALAPNTTYAVYATLVRSDHRYADTAHQPVRLATQPRGQMPGQITDVRFGEFVGSASETAELLDVQLSWQPARDRSCLYTVIWWHDGRDRREMTTQPGTMLYTIRGLSFNVNYKICVSGYHRINSNLGKCAWFPLSTPTCQQFYGKESRHCDPHRPAHLTVTPTETGPNEYAVRVAWAPPPDHPDRYTVEIIDQSNHRYCDHVLGNATHADFNGSRGMLLSPEAIVRVTALSADDSRSAWHAVSLRLPQSSSTRTVSGFSRRVWTGALLGIGLLALLLAVWWRRQQDYEFSVNRQHTKTAVNDIPLAITVEPTSSPNMPNELTALQSEINRIVAANSAALEIPATHIHIVCQVGHGAFGVVHRARLRPGQRDVAVKRLGSSSSCGGANATDEMRAFFAEIEMLATVGRHPNVVAIIGHVTSDVRQMQVITEFCSEGNMLAFLHRVYDRLQENGGRSDGQPTANFWPDRNDNATGYQTVLESYNFVESMTHKMLPADKQVQSIAVKCVRCPVEISPNSVPTSNANACAHKFAVRVLDCPNQYTSMPSQNNLPPQLPISTTTTWTLDGRPAASPRGKPPANPPAATTSSSSSDISITSADLLAMATQVAAGMRHLAQLRVVHRDLAARNVLVCADKTVRIADFGLSRRCGTDTKSGVGLAGSVSSMVGRKLPYRWTAPEALQPVCSSISMAGDVWSFGVLLWEMATLGALPYAGLHGADEVRDHLLAGHRLQRPAAASPDLYDVMLQCWRPEGEVQRPEWAELAERLNALRAQKEQHVRLAELVVSGDGGDIVKTNDLLTVFIPRMRMDG